MTDKQREFIEALPVPDDIDSMTDEEIEQWARKALGIED